MVVQNPCKEMIIGAIPTVVQIIKKIKHMDTKRNIIGSIGFFLLCFGMCLADSESFIPTLVCMGLGVIMMKPLFEGGKNE